MADERARFPGDEIDDVVPAGSIFPAHRRYWLYLAAGVGLVLLFSWEMGQDFAPELAVLIGIGLLVALWAVRLIASRVELTTVGITVHMPLSPPQHVDFRQMVSASEEGRTNQVITVIYYPVAPDGLLDLQNPRTLFLPAVESQARLLAAIQREMPIL